MADASLIPIANDPVAILFHPSAVPVVDVFRSIGSLEDQYDLALLDGPEHLLSAYVDATAAKGIVSDVLLLAFALTRQRGRTFSHRPLRSRLGSLDEYCLMAMIGSSRQGTLEVAREASAILGVSPLDLLPALAGELARQMDLGAIVFPVPTLSQFRAMVGIEGAQLEAIVEASSKPGRHFSF
ncbi:MAG TPA: hypothetical protein VEZ24_17720 [Microvirga sp.]|nr:hypothetical protein [Microvirga sp.]